MISKRLIGGFAALALLTGACANNDGSETAAATPEDPAAAAAAVPAETAEATETPVAAGPAVFLGSTELGNILIGSDGRSLYGFTNDIDAVSACYGGCEEAWPPVIVDESWTVGPGLDLGIFATTVRDDGQLQLVAGKWPLYYYIGDEAPGQVNGQGSGDVWFAANIDGSLLLDAPAADPAVAEEGDPAEEAAAAGSVVSVATTDLGETLVDANGLTLYGFTQDTDGVPTCEGACADAWPPVIVDALPADLDPAVYSVATRPDGQLQLVAGVWPLYLFAGDAAPGDINGQGSGDVWFAVAPDGSLLGRNDGTATDSAATDSAATDDASTDSGSAGGSEDGSGDSGSDESDSDY